MSISRRKKGRSHHHHKRRRFGGYISGNTDRGVGFDRRYQLEDAQRRKKEAPKFSLFSIPTWLDYKVNKDVVDQDDMRRISARYDSARTSVDKQGSLETLKDMLIVHDINQNPEDYLKEWQKGKHKRNNWVKWLTRIGLGAAGAAGAYGLYQYGIPYIGNLLSSKAPGVVAAAKAVFSSDAAAQGAVPDDMSAAPSSENIALTKGMLEKLARKDPRMFAQLYDALNTYSIGSGYRRWRRRVKRRKHHKRK